MTSSNIRMLLPFQMKWIYIKLKEIYIEFEIERIIRFFVFIGIDWDQQNMQQRDDKYLLWNKIDWIPISFVWIYYITHFHSIHSTNLMSKVFIWLGQEWRKRRRNILIFLEWDKTIKNLPFLFLHFCLSWKKYDKNQ